MTANDHDRISHVDVSDELESAFREYALSVLVSRAIPDAADGLKPVQRRLLYAMYKARITPEKPHRKSIASVSEALKSYHPHGDQACYLALVRLAQSFSMTVPLVDGHGNFGSLDNPPAAARYTEARLAPSAMALLDGVNENTVQMRPNFDASTTEPAVLPAGWPVLLTEGASGIAVGTTTLIPPHNLREVTDAVCLWLDNPKVTVKDVLAVMPHPDYPTGGQLLPADWEAIYTSGTGSFRLRGGYQVERDGRDVIVVISALPYSVGPERLIEKARGLMATDRLASVSSIDDYSDRHTGLEVRVVVAKGFSAQQAIDDLCRLTPLEEAVHVNFVALVDGRPRQVGLLDLIAAYGNHRLNVVRKRSAYRLGKAEGRLSTVSALLAALDQLDAVVAIARNAKSAKAAETAIAQLLDVSITDAKAVLELSLRQLGRLEFKKLDSERKELTRTITGLKKVLRSDKALRELVKAELAEQAETFGSDRRTQMHNPHGDTLTVSVQPGCQDEGVRGTVTLDGEFAAADHPLAGSSVDLPALVVCSDGTAVRIERLDVAAGPVSAAAVGGSGRIVGAASAGGGLCVVSAGGTVKRLAGGDLEAMTAGKPRNVFPAGDLVAAFACGPDDDVVMVNTLGKALRFPAAQVREQGLRAGGMAGMSGGDILTAGVAGPGAVIGLANRENDVVVATDDVMVRNRAGGGQRVPGWKPKWEPLVAWVGPSPKLRKRPLGFIARRA